MLAADYYERQPSYEWESVERWENEGGRLRQHHGLSLDSIGEDYLRRMEQTIPIGRPGEPVNIARALLFLDSDEANYITGQTLVVDGRQTLPEAVSAV